MPVKKVPTPKGTKGPCYVWGNHGKVYCGAGAKKKAERQGQAAYASGYRGGNSLNMG